MTFFSGVVAPLVFTRLEPETAGRFIRALFPWYYLTLGATSLLALLVLLPAAGRHTVPIALTGLTAAGFVYARQFLMPRINRARDAHQAGDSAAGRRFERLHRWSVIINGVQWLAVLVALGMLLTLGADGAGRNG
jgi:hypothetical protein